MSRTGKKPVAIPSGVTAAIENGQLSVKGPKGTLSISLEDANLHNGWLQVWAKPNEGASGFGQRVATLCAVHDRVVERCRVDHVEQLVDVDAESGGLIDMNVTIAQLRTAAENLERGVVEIAEHGLLGGMSHGVRVLRAVPRGGFGLVAAGASLAADEAELLC